MTSGYAAWGAIRGIMIATIVAGTLYLLSAFAFDIWYGGSPIAVLEGIGSAVVERGAVGNAYVLAAAGLGLHFAIMLAMATVYVLGAALLRPLNRLWLLSGIVYGLALWGIMDRALLPWRWPTLFPLTATTDIAEQIFDHVVLVGLPIALVARRATRWRRVYM